MSLIKHPRCSKKRTGATAVEFALVVPFVFAAFFTAFEFCRVAMIRHSADNAIYEGARQAIIPGGTAAEAEQRTRELLSAVGVSNAAISIQPSSITDDTRDVTVQISIELNNNSFVTPLFFRNKSIERELTMRREGKR